MGGLLGQPHTSYANLYDHLHCAHATMRDYLSILVSTGRPAHHHPGVLWHAIADYILWAPSNPVYMFFKQLLTADAHPVTKHTLGGKGRQRTKCLRTFATWRSRLHVRVKYVVT